MKAKLLTFLFLAGSLSLFATNFPVTNGNDSGTGSLRQAIIDANADATATVGAPHTITPDATYTISLVTALPSITKSVKINGTAANQLILDLPNLAASVLPITGNLGISVEFNYLTFKDATTTNGVNGLALWINSSTTSPNTVAFKNCKFSNLINQNTSSGADCNGGAINISAGNTVTISDSWFEGNKTITQNTTTSRNASGGAINSSSNLTITNTTFKNNECNLLSTTLGNARGGAIRIIGSTLDCTGCTFEDNYAYTYAGVISATSLTSSPFTSATVKLTGCTVSAPVRSQLAGTGVGNGAAIYVEMGVTVAQVAGVPTLEITNSILKDQLNKSATTTGGAIFSQAVTTITNTQISGNSACRGGGISLTHGLTNTTSLISYKPKLTMIKCTVSGNSLNGLNASSIGGGVYVAGTSTLLTDDCTFANCTFSGNTTPTLVASGGTTVTTSSGGGLHFGNGSSAAWTAKATLNNCTFTGNITNGNVADGNGVGGGLTREGTAVVELNYCLIAGNSPNSTNSGRNISTLSGTLGSTTGRNLFGITAPSATSGAITIDNVTYTGAITDLLNPTLADNGGTTTLPDGAYVKTHALIASGSAINPSSAGSGTQAIDQRGAGRDITPDMGAFEFSGTFPVVTLIDAHTGNWQTASNWSGGLVPTSTDEVIIPNTTGGSLLINSNVSIKKLTIDSGATLTVNSGVNLTVTEAITNNGTMTLANNSNLIQVNPSATNSGNITINRNSNPLYRLDYTMWSSPVTGSQTLAGFSPLTSQSPNRFYAYNPSTNLYAEVSPTTTFSAGTGYLIRMPNTNPTTNYDAGTATLVYPGVFTGVPTNGTITLSSLSSDKFYAVGNPYPSTISAQAFLSGNATGGTLYFWRKTNAASGSAYATYTAAGSTTTTPTSAAPNGTIQVGQGFIVKTGVAATSLAFTNTMRTANNQNQIFKTKQEAKDRLWLNLTNTSGVFSQALVGYFSDADSGVDAYDGKYINDSPVALTSSINNEEYTIQGRPAFDASDVVDLNFKTDVAGDYTIAIDHTDGQLSSTPEVYLVDAQTGTETNLKSTSYNFTAAAGTNSARFSLKYQKTLKVDAPAFNENTVSVYKNNGVLYVNSSSIPMKTIEVYDVQGRLLFSQNNVKTTTVTINTLKTIHQVLVVKISGEDNSVVTKKILN